MGELGFTMWMELSSPPILPGELRFLCLTIAILWISLQYLLFWKHEGLCCSDSRVHEQNVYEGLEHVGVIQAYSDSASKAESGFLEASSDFEHDPGLWNALHNPRPPQEGITDHVAPRSPY